MCAQIDALGRFIEIDETSVKKKIKYVKGKRHADCWLFSGVDPWFSIITFEKQINAVVLPLI